MIEGFSANLTDQRIWGFLGIMVLPHVFLEHALPLVVPGTVIYFTYEYVTILAWNSVWLFSLLTLQLVLVEKPFWYVYFNLLLLVSHEFAFRAVETIQLLVNDLEMALDVVLTREGHGAARDWATPGFITRVCQLVPLEVVLALEGLPAFEALVRLQVQVSFINMPLEFTCLREPPMA
jgi:hypothetical protein